MRFPNPSTVTVSRKRVQRRGWLVQWTEGQPDTDHGWAVQNANGAWTMIKSTCVCVCQDTFVYIYVYIYIYDYTCMYIYTHTCIQKNTSSGFVWTSRGKITWSASGFGAPWRLKRPWVRSHVIRWQHSPRLGGRSKTCGFSGWNGALLAMVINQHNST